MDPSFRDPEVSCHILLFCLTFPSAAEERAADPWAQQGEGQSVIITLGSHFQNSHFDSLCTSTALKFNNKYLLYTKVLKNENSTAWSSCHIKPETKCSCEGREPTEREQDRSFISLSSTNFCLSVPFMMWYPLAAGRGTKLLPLNNSIKTCHSSTTAKLAFPDPWCHYFIFYPSPSST